MKAAVLCAMALLAVAGSARADNVGADMEAHVWMATLQYQDVAMRRRHRHRSRQPRQRYISPSLADQQQDGGAEPGVAPFEQNVVIDVPHAGAGLTVSYRVWPIWCERVGGVECPRVVRTISILEP